MSRRVVAVVVGLGLAAGVAVPAAGLAAPVPKHLMADPPSYYPTRVGTKWVYLRGKQEETWVIAKVEVKEKERIVSVENVRKEGNKPQQTVSVRPDGLFLVSEHGKNYAVPWCIFKLPHKKGETWNTLNPHGAMESAGEERVKVPAGEFVAARVEWEVGGGRKAIFWYSPKVGLVQLDVDGTPHLVLKSFTPGEG